MCTPSCCKLGLNPDRGTALMALRAVIFLPITQMLTSPVPVELGLRGMQTLFLREWVTLHSQHGGRACVGEPQRLHACAYVFASSCGCWFPCVHDDPHMHRYVSLWVCVSSCARAPSWARLSPWAPGVSATHLLHLSPIACVTFHLWVVRPASMYGSEAELLLKEFSLNKAHSSTCSLFWNGELVASAVHGV